MHRHQTGKGSKLLDNAQPWQFTFWAQLILGNVISKLGSARSVLLSFWRIFLEKMCFDILTNENL